MLSLSGGQKSTRQHRWSSQRLTGNSAAASAAPWSDSSMTATTAASEADGNSGTSGTAISPKIYSALSLLWDYAGLLGWTPVKSKSNIQLFESSLLASQTESASARRRQSSVSPSECSVPLSLFVVKGSTVMLSSLDEIHHQLFYRDSTLLQRCVETACGFDIFEKALAYRLDPKDENLPLPQHSSLVLAEGSARLITSTDKSKPAMAPQVVPVQISHPGNGASPSASPTGAATPAATVASESFGSSARLNAPARSGDGANKGLITEGGGPALHSEGPDVSPSHINEDLSFVTLFRNWHTKMDEAEATSNARQDKDSFIAKNTTNQRKNSRRQLKPRFSLLKRGSSVKQVEEDSTQDGDGDEESERFKHFINSVIGNISGIVFRPLDSSTGGRVHTKERDQGRVRVRVDFYSAFPLEITEQQTPSSLTSKQIKHIQDVTVSILQAIQECFTTSSLSYHGFLHPQQWVTDAQRTHCSLCLKTFHLLRRRKHHCRMCGEVVCVRCCALKVVELPLLGIRSVRICKNCSYFSCGYDCTAPPPALVDLSPSSYSSGSSMSVLVAHLGYVSRARKYSLMQQESSLFVRQSSYSAVRPLRSMDTVSVASTASDDKDSLYKHCGKKDPPMLRKATITILEVEEEDLNRPSPTPRAFELVDNQRRHHSPEIEKATTRDFLVPETEDPKKEEVVSDANLDTSPDIFSFSPSSSVYFNSPRESEDILAFTGTSAASFLSDIQGLEKHLLDPVSGLADALPLKQTMPKGSESLDPTHLSVSVRGKPQEQKEEGRTTVDALVSSTSSLHAGLPKSEATESSGLSLDSSSIMPADTLSLVPYVPSSATSSNAPLDQLETIESSTSQWKSYYIPSSLLGTAGSTGASAYWAEIDTQAHNNAGALTLGSGSYSTSGSSTSHVISSSYLTSGSDKTPCLDIVPSSRGNNRRSRGTDTESDDDIRVKTILCLEFIRDTQLMYLEFTCQEIASAIGVPMVAVSLIGRDTQFFPATYGFPTLTPITLQTAYKAASSSRRRRMPRAFSLCNYTLMLRDPLVIPDTERDPRFHFTPSSFLRVRDNSMRNDTECVDKEGEEGEVERAKAYRELLDCRIRFYAGVQLVTSNNICIGTLCAFDSCPRKGTISEGDVFLLKGFANRVMRYIESGGEEGEAEVVDIDSICSGLDDNRKEEEEALVLYQLGARPVEPIPNRKRALLKSSSSASSILARRRDRMDSYASAASAQSFASGSSGYYQASTSGVGYRGHQASSGYGNRPPQRSLPADQKKKTKKWQLSLIDDEGLYRSDNVQNTQKEALAATTSIHSRPKTRSGPEHDRRVPHSSNQRETEQERSQVPPVSMLRQSFKASSYGNNGPQSIENRRKNYLLDFSEELQNHNDEAAAYITKMGLGRTTTSPEEQPEQEGNNEEAAREDEAVQALDHWGLC